MKETGIVTFGCRLNAYESEAIRAHLAAAGITDAIVVNTCAVTAEAVRQSHQAIRKLKREHPDKRIVVTGCAAQVAPEDYAAMAEVDLVLGNAEKMDAASYAHGANARTRVGDIMAETAAKAQPVTGFEGKSRAFLQVQNGCDHRCTFCIIPFGRGRSRSIDPDEAVAGARRLAANGYGEIVLTGVDLTSYGADLTGKPSLGALVRTLLAQVPDIARLRLSSIDAIEIDDELIAAIADEKKLMPHFHISAQSGDDMILKRMKRRHCRADIVRFCETVRAARPDAVFGADLIAGFPTETDEMFANTLRLVDDAGFSLLHVFPFSPRPGTPAAAMPQLMRATVKERAKRLRERGEAALAAHLQRLIGSRQEVMMEKNGLGRTRGFLRVKIAGKTGAVFAARVTGATRDHLLAERAT